LMHVLLHSKVTVERRRKRMSKSGKEWRKR